MQQKYYAVRVGRTPGIYMNWEDCNKQVKGYKGAKFKSFTSIEEADDFVNKIENAEGINNEAINNKAIINEILSNENGIPMTNEIMAVAYVDGSYNAETKQFSYGVVMFHNGEEKHFSKKVEDEELAEMRNVAGEIKGAEAAMKYAIDNKVEKLFIYHDYEGIASWCLGHWKTNKKGTIEYKKFYDKIKGSVDITFIKVKGHSNDKYNDLADSLAKQAIF